MSHKKKIKTYKGQLNIFVDIWILWKQLISLIFNIYKLHTPLCAQDNKTSPGWFLNSKYFQSSWVKPKQSETKNLPSWYVEGKWNRILVSNMWHKQIQNQKGDVQRRQQRWARARRFGKVVNLNLTSKSKWCLDWWWRERGIPNRFMCKVEGKAPQWNGRYCLPLKKARSTSG